MAGVAAAIGVAWACGSHGEAAGPAPFDGGVVDAGPPLDPRCETQAAFVTTHPHASQQATAIGQDLVDVRGFHGRVYFAYGDLNQNTGPIVVSSYDPATKTWQDHLTFDTERIERFQIIGDQIWAPAADPRGALPDPEYAVGSATHVWKQVDIGPSLHVTDAIERVPGEVLLTGTAWVNQAARLGGGSVWRSVDGGAFDRIFPLFDDAGAPTLFDGIYVPFMGAALHGTAYVTGLGGAWAYDGGEWANGVPLNDFFRPVTFADRLVFAAAGDLYASDGVTRKRLDIRLFENPALWQFVLEPIPTFQSTEQHLVAIDVARNVLATDDLTHWSCIGKAPADVRSIGSLDGVVYFGGAGGRVYALPARSW